MTTSLAVEILGISGSGKSSYFREIYKLYNHNKNLNNYKITQNKKFWFFIFFELIQLPINILLLISIFDYFIDSEHTKNYKTILKRFLKVYKVYIISKFYKISINKTIIQESIIHLSINSFNKNPKRFVSTVKRLYRVKNIKSK